MDDLSFMNVSESREPALTTTHYIMISCYLNYFNNWHTKFKFPKKKMGKEPMVYFNS